VGVRHFILLLLVVLLLLCNSSLVGLGSLCLLMMIVGDQQCHGRIIFDLTDLLRWIFRWVS